MNINDKLRNYRLQYNDINKTWHLGYAENCKVIENSASESKIFICSPLGTSDVIDEYLIFNGEVPNITIDNNREDGYEAVYIYQK